MYLYIQIVNSRDSPMLRLAMQAQLQRSADVQYVANPLSYLPEYGYKFLLYVSTTRVDLEVFLHLLGLRLGYLDRRGFCRTLFEDNSPCTCFHRCLTIPVKGSDEVQACF